MGSAAISSEVVKATVFVSLLCFCFGLYGCMGCLEEERIALLQLWDSFNPHGSAVHLKVEQDDCCKWGFLGCDLFNSTYHVVSIGLSGLREIIGLTEKWFPNASLFTHFKELQYLYLDHNNIGGWIMPEALCELRNLKGLSLSQNSLDHEGLPECLGRNLPLLQSFTLEYNSLNLSSHLLSALCGLRNLSELNLSKNVVSDGSLPPCMLETFSSLEILYLRNFTVVEQSPNIFPALQRARNLQYLDLSYSNLNAKRIPPCLEQNNSSLGYLSLRGTFTKSSHITLEGVLCGWKKIMSLDLSLNDFSDESLPSCLLQNNSALEQLDLSSNKLKGSNGFSAGLCKLRKLQSLDLTNNSVDNTLWPCLNQLNSLETLSLSQNQISGTIPPLFSNHTSLVWLDLSSNNLDGMVFFSMFANLSTLLGIDLSNNRELEVETEFPTWVPAFQLNYLGLENCKLNKRTHGNIPCFISTQFQLVDLSLSYSSLQGAIPSWLIYNATDIYTGSLKLRGNHFHGPFPMPLGNETSMLTTLDISNNNIEGELPRNIDVLFPYLESFNISKNKLEGCIPPSFGNLINLWVLDLSNNYFVGKVPPRLTHNSTSLSQLILSNNGLDAMARVSNMTNLHVLSLDGNRFTKPFPIFPSSVPSLQLLDISRNSITSYFQDWLLVFPNLLSLLMRGNHFVGPIPSSLCQLQQLRFLDLSNNNLSGSIPSCFNNITSWLKESEAPDFGGIPKINGSAATPKINFATKGHLYSYEGLPLHLMTGIDLSLNQLTGAIPSQLGELRALHSLNLSCNSLVGKIPESFQGLEKLESLDLSHNKLVGKIPPQIVHLDFLSVFNVAFNQLSGKIPYEKHFDTFTKDSYIGNPGLCGPPTEINCSSPQPPHDEYKEGDIDEQSLIDNDLFFYSYVAISYLLGFWIVVAPLLLSRNWRRKYYGVVDRCIDWCSDGLFWFMYYIKNCW